jgi:glycosyltransferase involved in cell wall biosynthesis
MLFMSSSTVRPLISVVMPVHNTARYLDESIQSILGQTLEDFEFVILDDASTDDSGRILRAWAKRDARIRLIEAGQPLGPSRVYNHVVSQSRAPIIARMDSDDISEVRRFERQWEVLQNRPDVGLVGTLMEGIDRRGRRVRPRDRGRLVRRSLFAPFPHGSVMFRREVFDRVGGYREACVHWEDIDLFLRISDMSRILVLPDVLYHYRFHTDSITLTSSEKVIERSFDLMYRCLAERAAGRDYTPLLEAASAHGGGDASEAIRLRALFSLGSLRLWAGHSPAMTGALFSRSSLAWDRETLQTLVWAMWGSLSPRTLRAFLRLLVRARDRAASRRLKDGRPYEWRYE